MEIRTPAVAGMFYPGTEEALENELDRLIPANEGEKVDAIGIVSPHAGYIYSGSIAAETIASVNIPKKIILLGPNHTGLGSRASVMSDGEWSLPNGTVPVDSPLAEKLLGSARLFKRDILAHMKEHSLEVQIPFLLHERKDITIVPVSFMGLSLEDCRIAGKAIAQTITSTGEDVLIVASSDMTHFESQSSAKEKDSKAIDRVLSLDPEGLMRVVRENDISMCGVLPVTVMLFAALELGAKKASLVSYATSGDVSGDYDRVVGYAGMVIE